MRSTIFVSAFLLFQIERSLPDLLPWFGGSAGV